MDAQSSLGARTSATRPRTPSPLMSSRRRDWKGIVVELYRARDFEYVVRPSEHMIVVRRGESMDALPVPPSKPAGGNVTIMPAGRSAQLRFPGPSELQVMRVAASVVDAVAAEDHGKAAARVDLGAHESVSDSQIEYLGARLLEELRVSARASQSCVQGLVSLLAVHLVRHYAGCGDPQQQQTGKLPAYKLRQATDYIARNLASDLSLDAIAQTMCMSAWHFAHLFKHTTGLAPHRYVMECRMERAKTLLRDTSLPVSEIGSRVGYGNSSHFSTLFRQFTGASPMQYRRRA